MFTAEMEPVDRLLVAKTEAVRLLSISMRKLEYEIRNGEIQVRRIGRRTLIEMREVRRYSRKDHPKQPPKSKP